MLFPDEENQSQPVPLAPMSVWTPMEQLVVDESIAAQGIYISFE